MDWDESRKHVAAGPASALRLAVIWIVILMAVGLGLRVVGTAFGWFGQTAQLASTQFGPAELLRKYEWFKDASAQLDKLHADIGLYDQRRKSLQATYGETPRAQWPRDDREEWNLIESEVAGVKAAYNDLAAQYNAQMAKFNYRFANAGELPQGADRVLPREYRNYEVQ
jgi:hypothetical protein